MATQTNLAILTPAAMTAAEQAAIDAGTPGFTLMERAGQAVADALHARWPGTPVRVLAGPGGNGGDGFVAARHLVRMGHQVTLETLKPVEALIGDAALAAQAWDGPVVPLSPQATPNACVTLDALFGGGLSRGLDPLCTALTHQPGPVVSVDMPSGLNGLTGRADGAHFTADLTITFQALRPAHVLAHSRTACGDIRVVDIGVTVPDIWRENSPTDWAQLFPWPNLDAHKHARGHLMCVSGGVTGTGAARMAARAGLRIGSGLVTLLSPPAAVTTVAAQITAEMLQPFRDADELAQHIEAAACVVIGPAAGRSEATAKNVEAVLSGSAPAVIDADGLSQFASEPARLFERLRPIDVVTPHSGEFRRLFGDLESACANRLEAACEAAKIAGSVVLLKGPDTVVAAPDGRARVNRLDAPFLATAGSGDVLAGLIGGLMSQGLTAFDAAAMGAWIHARCGQLLGPGLIATDLPDQVPAVLHEISAIGG